MDNLNEFRRYFNKSFWKAFINKNIFIDNPPNKDRFTRNVFKEIYLKKYYPSIPQLYIDINKGKGVTRIIPVFSLKDYCVYYYCIKKLETKIAFNRIPNTFGGWTLGGLIRKNEDDEMVKRRMDYDKFEDFMAELNGISVSQHSFNPLAWSKAYGDLNAKLYASSKEKKYKFVTELDISNFYDSIRLDILEIKIREISDEKYSEIVALLFLFLNYWNRKTNSYNKQTVGIPQDALGDCSRILANFYLQSYDKFVYEICKKTGCKYLRYADDQFIFSNNQEESKYLIYMMSKKLNSMGLSVNQKKVKVLSTSELIEYRAFKIFNVVKSSKDKNDKVKVEALVDKYIELVNESKLAKIKDNGKSILTRILFCPALKKIDPIKRNVIVNFLMDENYLEFCRTSHLLKIYNLLGINQKRRLVFKLKKLTKKLMHNSFHYEVLGFFDKYDIHTKLVKTILKRLEQDLNL